MKKITIVHLLIICLSLMCVPSINFFLRDAHAIPNSNVPAPDGHPHTCGETRFPAKFIDGTVTWTNATADPYDASGILQTPNNFCHNHHCNQGFGGDKGNQKYSDRQSYDAYSCWDDRTYRRQSAPYPAFFERGHGFINEFPDAGGGPASSPHYYFSPNQTDGTTPCNWDANATDMISEAFLTWGGIESDELYLVTGINFEPTSDPAQADITVFWQPYRYSGVWRPTTRQLIFASNRTWYFPKNPLGTPIGQYHFFTIALHEVGHIVGLEDQCDTDDIMYYIERWEYLYNDTDGSGTVTPNDVRLYDVELSGTPPGYARGSTVNLGDNDERQRPRRILVNFNPDEKHDNTTGNNRYDWGEFIYRDVDNSGNVTAGDVRLEERGLYAAGSVVAAGDTDVGLGLVLFLANEKHEEFLPSNGRYDFRGPYLGDLDSDSIHGACDLYSIPAPDFGDAPDPTYPTKKASNGTRNLFIGREWLGANPTGQTTTTWEWDAKAVDVPDDGCVFWLPLLGVGIGFVDVTVSVTNWQSSRYNNTFGYELYLAIWIDWDENGWWDHPREMVVIDRLRPSTWGQNTWSNRYQFDVPCWSLAWARARLVYAKTGMNLFPWGLLPTLDSPDDGGEVEDYYLERERPPVGGIIVPVDKFGLLAPYVGLASTILVATVATAIYVKRVKHRKEKQ